VPAHALLHTRAATVFICTGACASVAAKVVVEKLEIESEKVNAGRGNGRDNGPYGNGP
tara:strand:+ start:198 stop:371 length:174 start_codon:yes stop_codon:yes gene_type:complete